MSFTSSKRVTVQKPCKASDINTLYTNSDYLVGLLPNVGHAGARLVKNSQNISGGGVGRIVSWSSATYDQNPFSGGVWWSNLSPTIIFTPAGVRYVQFDLSFTVDSSTRDLSEGDIRLVDDLGFNFEGMPSLVVDGMHSGHITSGIIDTFTLGTSQFRVEILFNLGTAADISFVLSTKGYPQ